MLAFDWGVIVLAVAIAVVPGSPLRLILVWLMFGWAQHGLAIVGHEAAHRILVRGAGANRWIGRWATWGAIGICFEGYKRLHLAHHRLVGTPEDPEHKVLPRRPYLLRFRASTPWTGAAAALFGGAIGESMGFVAETRARSLREAVPVVAMGIAPWALAWSTGTLHVAALWTASTATSLFFFSRIRTFGEHLGADSTHRLSAPPVLRWLTHPHHVDHHWEHHLLPSVPCHRLPALRAHVRTDEVAGLVATWRERAASESV